MRRMNKSSISVLLFLCLIAAAVSGGCAGESEEFPGGQGQTVGNPVSLLQPHQK